MAKYPVRLTTFDEVVAHYESIVPIRGTDIRPIGCRGRKFEEIRKQDDNHYALGRNGWRGFTAYIVWRRYPHGANVTLLNGIGEEAHTSIYAFHDYFMPLGMSLHIRGGKQFVHTDWNADNRGDYLPKGEDGLTIGRKELTYERSTLGVKQVWALVSPSHSLPRKVVDKERKAKYKDGIAEFTQWAWAMAPVIGADNVGTWREAKIRSREAYMHAHSQGRQFMHLLTDPTDEDRMKILLQLMYEMREAAVYWDDNKMAHVTPSLFDDLPKFKRKVNAFVNKYGCFTSVTTD
tara:strand:+ start:878 stop:1750 length:873 start_codon:yes stop_codon:yes gene_type:complete